MDTANSAFSLAIPLLDLQRGERILELGCGDGWACRRLATLLPEGLVIGLDLSDDQVRDARGKSISFENVLFLWSAAEQIPWQENFFTNVLCVNSLQYFQDVGRVCREVYRVLVPGGRFWTLDLEPEKDVGAQEAPNSAEAARIRPIEERIRMLGQIGFEEVSSRSLPNSSPNALPDSGIDTAPDGVVLVSARKPQK